LRRNLETEIADQAAAAELGLNEAIGDEVELAPQTLARATVCVVQHVGDEPLEIGEIQVKHLARELLLRAEVVGERTLRGRRFGDNVAHPAPP
jgi:hypothetical protein